MNHLKGFSDLFEAKSNILIDVAKDLMNIKIDGNRPDNTDGAYEVEQNSTSISVSFRDLGRWDNDEEAHGGDEEDRDWREDDDQRIWAPGEHKKYLAKFNDWAQNFSWYKSVKLSIQTGEKSYCDFCIELK